MRIGGVRHARPGRRSNRGAKRVAAIPVLDAREPLRADRILVPKKRVVLRRAEDVGPNPRCAGDLADVARLEITDTRSRLRLLPHQAHRLLVLRLRRIVRRGAEALGREALVLAAVFETEQVVESAKIGVLVRIPAVAGDGQGEARPRAEQLEELVLVAPPELDGERFDRALGPRKPRLADREVLEAIRAIGPEAVDVILVLMGHDDEVEAMAGRSPDRIDDIADPFGREGFLTARLVAAIDEHVDRLFGVVRVRKGDEEAIAVTRSEHPYGGAVLRREEPLAHRSSSSTSCSRANSSSRAPMGRTSTLSASPASKALPTAPSSPLR